MIRHYAVPLAIWVGVLLILLLAEIIPRVHRLIRNLVAAWTADVNRFDP